MDLYIDLAVNLHLDALSYANFAIATRTCSRSSTNSCAYMRSGSHDARALHVSLMKYVERAHEPLVCVYCAQVSARTYEYLVGAAKRLLRSS